MALKVVNTESLDAVANALNEAAGKSGKLVFPDEYISTAKGLSAGGGGEDLSTVLAEQEELVAELKGLLATKAGVKIESPSPKDVNFYDYDGTLLHSYTVEEAQALSELPELPTQKGLICQGWNWSLEDIKAHNRAVNVGATYVTDDGKTRLYITIAAEGRMTVPLYFNQTVANGVTIDWGDGSATETLSGTGYVTTSHTYANIGDYVISLDVTNGEFRVGAASSSYCVMGAANNNGRIYCNMLRKVEIGDNTIIYNYAFNGCYSLASVVIPNGVTNIGSNAFNLCYSLASVVLPNSVIDPLGSNAFYYCQSLSRISIPNSIRRMGAYVFYQCNALTNIVIPKDFLFIGTDAFRDCCSLANIVIPDGITSINENAFNGCYSLASVVIPKGVTNIDSNAFAYCYGMAFYDFTRHTSVPTLANSSAFNGIPTDCKILVPASLYDEWKAATNWSTSSIASKIVAVEV